MNDDISCEVLEDDKTEIKMISDAKLNLSPSNDEFNPATNDQNKQTKEGISMFNMCYEILSTNESQF